MSDEQRDRMAADGAVDLPGASAFTGLGRTYLYMLMDSGRLTYIKVGKRRLIPRVELRRLLAESLVAARSGETVAV
jgi:excisionase family DNA binding protein